MSYATLEVLACIVCFGLGMAVSEFMHERLRRRFQQQIYDALNGGMGITRAEFKDLYRDVERLRAMFHKNVAGPSDGHDPVK